MSPSEYANRLASYIKDPSTIRVRTLEQYGRAPDINRIKEMQAEHERLRSRPWNYLLRPKYDDDATVGLKCKDVKLEVSEEPKIENDGPVFGVPPWGVGLRHIPEMISQVAKAFHLNYEDIVGESRKAYIVNVRFLVARLLVDRGNSRSQVGAWLNRDHSTVTSALDRFDDVAKRNEGIARAYAYFTELWSKPKPD